MTSPATALQPDLTATSRWKQSVSVIVPVYNEAAHLHELLHAIQASPVKKEIIIVDDGSTDGTRAKNCMPCRRPTVLPSCSTKKITAKARPSAPLWLTPAASMF